MYEHVTFRYIWFIHLYKKLQKEKSGNHYSRKLNNNEWLSINLLTHPSSIFPETLNMIATVLHPPSLTPQLILEP